MKEKRKKICILIYYYIYIHVEDASHFIRVHFSSLFRFVGLFTVLKNACDRAWCLFCTLLPCCGCHSAPFF